MKYSACIEMLFAEEPDLARRIPLARAAGLDGVEFWKWTNKDIAPIETALAETDLPLVAMVAEPMIPLTDPAQHDAFMAGLEDSIATARRLGTGVLIAQTGDDLPGRSRADQRAALVAVLRRAADRLEGTGLCIAVEPLNTLIDHAGYYLSSTAEGLDIVDEVARPEIRLLYDLYHSAVMGEDIAEVLAGRVDRLAHVHVADTEGRAEPGSGPLDLERRLRWLRDAGYEGFVGLEYRPTRPTPETLEFRQAFGL